MKEVFNVRSLAEGEEGRVLKILDSQLQNRLTELGFQKGKKVKVIRKSSWSDSVLVLISGQVFGLRKEEADQILLAS